jgi:hypothetical protein
MEDNMGKGVRIVIGSILLGSLAMAAGVAAPQTKSEATITVTITGTGLEGVDQPFFVLSRSRSETVRWHNSTDKECTLTFSGGSPFPRRVIISAGGFSDVFSAANAPGPPAGWPEDTVYKVYHYSVDLAGGSLFESPGGAVKP